MSSRRFAVLWLKAFRESAEKVCTLHADRTTVSGSNATDRWEAVSTSGRTFHTNDSRSRIKQESAYWDAAAPPHALGLLVSIHRGAAGPVLTGVTVA